MKKHTVCHSVTAAPAAAKSKVKRSGSLLKIGLDIHRERFGVSWRWHPAPVESSVDYSKEPTTLVVIEFEEVEGGTLLRLIESGFDRIPPSRRLEAFRMNSEGWAEQMRNIEKHVATA